jgi:hypothetical protein
MIVRFRLFSSTSVTLGASYQPDLEGVMLTMGFRERTTIAIAATLAMAVSANAAIAQSYSGRWPMTVTHSQRSNGTFCATLTDNGSLGWPHSGPASLPGGSGGSLFGTFQVIDRSIVLTFESPGGTGQNAGVLFVASADNGKIGKGVYEVVYGGQELDSGVLTFGMKGGC